MKDLSAKTDKELLILVAESNEAAYTEIYQRYWKKLLAIAYHHTQDKSTAEELVQEVLISLWDRRTNLDIDELQHYLAGAIKFAIYKDLSRGKRRAEIAKNFYQPIQENQEEEIHARLLKEYIDGLIEQLPEKCRLVFKYSRQEYKTNPEIARELSISEKSVEAHITRALKILRNNLRRAKLLGVLAFMVYLFF